MYIQTPPWDTGITPPEVIDFLDTHPPGRAIDLGCGTGTNVLTLHQRGWDVTGIDFVPAAIRQAEEKAAKAGADVRLFVGDVSNANYFDGPYDLILDIGCYHILKPDQRRRYRENVHANLADGGTYMLYGFLSDSHSQRISPTDITHFQNHLTLVKREDGYDPSHPKSTWLWFTTKDA